ncbi:hypothetical protein MCHI_001150 [Candidatus Magnetoovum chiemensis]|nr:hypothetical protein MCHI_001150 [Candidatus Magnetoovum chiemensis]
MAKQALNRLKLRQALMSFEALCSTNYSMPNLSLCETSHQGNVTPSRQI